MIIDIIKKPIFLQPVYKEKIWGGTRIKDEFHRDINEKLIAESWEISSNQNGDNVVKNEEYNGMTLSELFLKHKELFGTKMQNCEKFPLLIKYIDAHDNLSVQLHPSKNSNDSKEECWYILDANSDAEIIYGLNINPTKEEFKKIIKNNELKNFLNYRKIKKGDFIHVPSGFVHALLKGIFLVEIQQNSDTTYRIYDWDREEKRELHIEESINNISENQKNEKPFLNCYNNLGEQILLNGEYFNVSKVNSEQNYIGSSTKESFTLINILECDQATLHIYNKDYTLKKGDSFILPSDDVKYTIKGKTEFLKTWV